MCLHFIVVGLEVGVDWSMLLVAQHCNWLSSLMGSSMTDEPYRRGRILPSVRKDDCHGLTWALLTSLSLLLKVAYSVFLERHHTTPHRTHRSRPVAGLLFEVPNAASLLQIAWLVFVPLPWGTQRSFSLL